MPLNTFFLSVISLDFWQVWATVQHGHLGLLIKSLRLLLIPPLINGPIKVLMVEELTKNGVRAVK